jgi:hypothetical protein
MDAALSMHISGQKGRRMVPLVISGGRMATDPCCMAGDGRSRNG